MQNSIRASAYRFGIARFNVAAEGSGAFLYWQTSGEVNSDHFEIEQSTDSRNWRRIGSVAAHEISFENADYTFSDSNPGLGLVYYRLKMVDLDGSFAYSAIRKLLLENDAETAVFPNPIHAGEQPDILSGKKDQILGFRLYDLHGKLVREASNLRSIFSGTDLAPGKYVVKISFLDGSDKSMIIIKR